MRGPQAIDFVLRGRVDAVEITPAKNLAVLRNAALALLPFEPHSSLNTAFDHYRDYRGKSLKRIKSALAFPE